VQTVNAVVLSGGSAYGLAAADGVMRYLEEHHVGYKVGTDFVVPIVPAAILMDLDYGAPGIRPDAALGYTACETASAAPVSQGTVGAGTGCRVGAMMGNALATKGGIGSASVDLGDGLIVAALIAVNAIGDVIDTDGQIMAGMRLPPDGKTFANMLAVMRSMARMTDAPPSQNTVIGVVATNARLTKEETNKVAQMAQDGLARAVRPAHTLFDGDTLFALATGQIPANVNVIGAYAAEVVADAIRNGIRAATTLGDVRSYKD
ncbi:MAG TPA: P1 family peptidase, partial [Phototrophicaceae bacterium]|nr:P1 family peptidase [Phototrophicaceae bacterium]